MYVNKLKSTKITWIWTDRYIVDLDREIEMLVNFMVGGGVLNGTSLLVSSYFLNY